MIPYLKPLAHRVSLAHLAVVALLGLLAFLAWMAWWVAGEPSDPWARPAQPDPEEPPDPLGFRVNPLRPEMPDHLAWMASRGPRVLPEPPARSVLRAHRER